MEISELLKKGMEELGLIYSEKIESDFLIYKKLLLEWNEKINLTAITEDKEIITKHFFDSLSVLSILDKSVKIIDIGTGAGFPGIPLKIYDNSIKLTLLDSLNKRIKFLDDVVEKLTLTNTITIHMRSEDGGKKSEFREQYDVATSRAVARLPILCELCLPYVKVGGKFIALKGSAVQEEVEESLGAISELGGKLKEIKEVKIPFTDITHYLVIIEKIKRTPKKYPRIMKRINNEVIKNK